MPRVRRRPPSASFQAEALPDSGNPYRTQPATPKALSRMTPHPAAPPSPSLQTLRHRPAASGRQLSTQYKCRRSRDPCHRHDRPDHTPARRPLKPDRARSARSCMAAATGSRAQEVMWQVFPVSMARRSKSIHGLMWSADEVASWWICSDVLSVLAVAFTGCLEFMVAGCGKGGKAQRSVAGAGDE
ncbi:hypothetical protein MPH_04576 [Macrophomina phaseolina MS6]|uniref:Uncharacterized protein n=1 Tax=Macrophomina phaseolina (strain MS6) TaxID=1126212 RepID=K2RZP8_MACPH|nr:hypothetical protein MPH_04576 [Macrophomina phaseolina MS6]